MAVATTMTRNVENITVFLLALLCTSRCEIFFMLLGSMASKRTKASAEERTTVTSAEQIRVMRMAHAGEESKERRALLE